jgi:hypothetical protein
MSERYFEFNCEKKKREKIKLMLWVEKDTLNRLELLRPDKITIQECIRQILDNYLTDPEI